jgi:hypothetical protein
MEDAEAPGAPADPLDQGADVPEELNVPAAAQAQDEDQAPAPDPLKAKKKKPRILKVRISRLYATRYIYLNSRIYPHELAAVIYATLCKGVGQATLQREEYEKEMVVGLFWQFKGTTRYVPITILAQKLDYFCSGNRVGHPPPKNYSPLALTKAHALFHIPRSSTWRIRTTSACSGRTRWSTSWPSSPR